MKEFANFIRKVDETTKTTLKINAIAEYFELANDEDKLWTIALFTSRRPKRAVPAALIRKWAAEVANLPLWLFEESYHIVGDLAETVSLLVAREGNSDYSLTEIIEIVIELIEKSEEEKEERVKSLWENFTQAECFIFNKILTGGFRIGVSQKNLVKGLAKATGIEENVLAHRLMGNWSPKTHTFKSLIEEYNAEDDASKPYPFYLAYPLDSELVDLGEMKDWQIELKWDGIRGQIIKRNGSLFIWSRGEELVTDKYPEFESLKNSTADNFVIDGEILPWKDNQPMTFHDMQKRIGRKTVGKKLLQDVPIRFMAYDILECNANDIRKQSLSERRKQLVELVSEVNQSCLMLSKTVVLDSWSQLKEEQKKAREEGTEGLMLKRLSSAYEIGRKKGNWWKWKVDPYTIDAVMTYAMRGHGRRATLYTDLTFGLWENNELVTFAKAYSGLTDKEFKEINQFIRKNTLQKFGPVKQVKPQLVFEIAFEGIAKSTRHKSGIAVRFPRIHRWRKDKPAEEANTLDDLKALL
ncbi:MAG: ATP-dependent DNA ligase [Lishizhenia sp.]